MYDIYVDEFKICELPTLEVLQYNCKFKNKCKEARRKNILYSIEKVTRAPKNRLKIAESLDICSSCHRSLGGPECKCSILSLSDR